MRIFALLENLKSYNRRVALLTLFLHCHIVQQAEDLTQMLQIHRRIYLQPSAKYYHCGRHWPGR